MTDAASRLILALDVPSTNEAEKLVETLGTSVQFYKIGLELLFRGGMDLANSLVRQNKKVFIDAKFLDIGNTVEKAVANIASTGAHFLTVHGVDRKTTDAAVRGKRDSNLKLLAVTVLTSLDQSDLEQQGINSPIEELVLRRARFAQESGIDGIVASAMEAQAIRQTLGGELTIVTPGIRPKGTEVGDQSRVMTPEKAIEQGADYLVVGRPITKASDPKQAAETIVDAMNKAFAAKR